LRNVFFVFILDGGPSLYSGVFTTVQRRRLPTASAPLLAYVLPQISSKHKNM
jgi:hypothetical protein